VQSARVRGCGGLPRRSGEAAKAGAGATLTFAALLLACNGAAAVDSESRVTGQQPAPAPSTPRTVAPSHPAFDSARAWQDLERQVAFGPRPSGSAALQQTRDYITSELKKAGIETRLQRFMAKTPLGEVSMANVIGTIPGRRPERIALASHFDTKLFRDIRFVGASDAASSTAALLELGRVLKARQNEYTIELLFFDGEEAVVEWNLNNDNTYGSRHYVQAAQQADTIRGLQALVLLDMIGDKDLLIRRDSNSTPWLVDIVWNAAARAGHRAVFSNELTTIDDYHMPFLRAGIPSVDVIDLDYPAWHTADDTIDHVSARSLQIVGDVILAALPDIEQRLASAKSR
jgi:glutaminyl-peptide cyclotransferase